MRYLPLIHSSPQSSYFFLYKYSYDLNGNLTSKSGGTKTTAYEYDSDTRALKKTTYPPPQGAGGQASVTISYTYDSQRGWVTSVVTKDSAQAVLGSFTYDLHDKVGNRKHISEQVKQPDGSTASSELTYAPPQSIGGQATLAYRLTDENRTGANAYTIQFTYDEVGNRLTQTKDATLTEYTYRTDRGRITSVIMTPPPKTVSSAIGVKEGFVR